mgnify:CR=1 FL=1
MLTAPRLREWVRITSHSVDSPSALPASGLSVSVPRFWGLNGVSARSNTLLFGPPSLRLPTKGAEDLTLLLGPIFANVILGDEINRAPAKTQAALLEAMQESQVTIEGETHQLPSPFLVLATQNPIEQEGVYQLPEAQLDRFLLKVEITYPTAAQEVEVLQTHHKPRGEVRAQMTAAEVTALRKVVDSVHVADELTHYIVNLARFTREHQQVELGASPRAALALLLAAKARAVIKDRDYILPDDVQQLAPAVMSHRILLQPEAELGGMRTQEIVKQALQRVRYSK